MPNSGVVKYNVKIRFEVDGIVERADIIGALFGQTEGLLGPEMNLNELQRTSKVGRIEVTLDVKSNKSSGEVIIPMSADISTTALIAAAVETIDKVGPFNAKFTLDVIEDVRELKKKLIVERAKKIVQEWAAKTMSESEEMLKDIYDAVKPARLTTYGKEHLACGAGIFDSDWIILVEGRADVINLLRSGYDNAIAIEGAKISDAVVRLSKEKSYVVAFLDGDRAADLILKELQNTIRIDKVVRAPQGREVEDLTPLEIQELLKDAVPSQQELKAKIREREREREGIGGTRYRERIAKEESGREVVVEEEEGVVLDEALTSKINEAFSSINETLEAVALDADMQQRFRVPVSEVVQRLQEEKDIKYLVLDGIITQRLLDACSKAGVEYVIGHRMADIKNTYNIKALTFNQLRLT
ncbi:DNA primase [archaeon HR04]|nr:DNA primase [archaeon HR04]